MIKDYIRNESDRSIAEDIRNRLENAKPCKNSFPLILFPSAKRPGPPTSDFAPQPAGLPPEWLDPGGLPLDPGPDSAPQRPRDQSLARDRTRSERLVRIRADRVEEIRSTGGPLLRYNQGRRKYRRGSYGKIGALEGTYASHC